MQGKCYQCPKTARPKRVTMHEEWIDGKRIITYLCAPCRKELGLLPSTPMGISGYLITRSGS